MSDERTGIWQVSQDEWCFSVAERTYRKGHDDQVAGDVEGGVGPPHVGRQTVDRPLEVQRPVPEGLQREAGGAHRDHEPDADGHDEDQHDLDRPLDPAVREDALVQQEDGYPREGKAEIVEEHAVPGGLSLELISTSERKKKTCRGHTYPFKGWKGKRVHLPCVAPGAVDHFCVASVLGVPDMA